MPAHIVRLLILMVVFAVVGVIARSIFIADSFGDFGHYRGDSVAEIAAQEPVFKGPEYCSMCHTDRHAEWTAGSHKKVKCENCHGAAGEHPATGKLPIPSDTVKLCSGCHQKMPTRPATQPQVVVRDHAGTSQCILCHNPHSPRLGDSIGAAQ
jgi:predicted CXXCH cytochrome family protein